MRKATLYLYCKTDKGWRYCKPARGTNNKVLPQTAIVDGKNQKHPEGKYVMNLGGQWIPAGDSATEATEKVNLTNAQLEYQRKGGKVVETESTPVPTPKPKGVAIADAQKAYLTYLDLQVRAGKIKERTLINATSITDEFLKWLAEHTKHTTVKEITAADVDAYTAWAIQQSPTHSTRTGANKYIRVGQFLKHAGHRITNNKQAPKYDKDTPVRMYSEAELAVFFQACTPCQALIFRTLLNTGLREMELVTLERADVDTAGGCLIIRPKPHYKFTPKNWSSRKVYITDETLAELTAHLKTHKHALVFPTKGGQPNYKLLRSLKRICKRAGLPEDEWWLHAYRSTYATNLLREGMGVPEVQRQLGHAPGSQSVWRYLRAIEGEQLRDRLNAMKQRKTTVVPAEAGNVVQMPERPQRVLRVQ